MKIGFAGRWSPLDKKSWSGIYYFTYKELKKYGDVEIFNFHYPKWLSTYLINVYKNPQKLFRRNVPVEFLKDYARYYSYQLNKELHRRKVDILFVASAPQLFAYLKLDIPIIFLTDGTFYQIQGYYDTWKNFAPFSIRQGIQLDRKAFLKATHIMAASDWAKESAIGDYGVEPEKVSVVPFGANLEFIPTADQLNYMANQPCRLLFLGVEWIRKGGAIALDTYKILKQQGVNAKLLIVGCVPPAPIDDSNVTVIPYLDKNNPADFKRLNDILLHTDILLLPTRAECAGIVFCEASAYGIPSVTTDTGGVSTYIKNDVNGFRFPMGAGPSEYAAYIKNLINNPQLFIQLKHSARAYFDRTLSWEAWGKSFYEIATNCIKQASNESSK